MKAVSFLVVKFSTYLNRRVFVMKRMACLRNEKEEKHSIVKSGCKFFKIDRLGSLNAGFQQVLLAQNF